MQGLRLGLLEIEAEAGKDQDLEGSFSVFLLSEGLESWAPRCVGLRRT